MAKRSAGLFIYRLTNGFLEVFLVHPGGPLYAKRDVAVWTIPKGEFEQEDPLDAAKREFREETGFDISGEFIELRPIKQKGGKVVFAWAVETDLDPSELVSNTFDFGGREYPEVDRGDWFGIEQARAKMLPSQTPLLDDLIEKLG